MDTTIDPQIGAITEHLKSVQAVMDAMKADLVKKQAFLDAAATALGALKAP